MDKHIEAIGEELRKRLNALKKRPMGWAMIDALCTLEEKGESAAAQGDQKPAQDEKPAEEETVEKKS